MKQFLCSLVIAVAALHGCSGYIWEKPARDGRRGFQRFQAIPPLQETANKLMKNFLEVDLPNNASRRSRRAALAQPKFDIVFLIDSSGSLTRRSFGQGVRALRKLTARGRPNNLYAAVSFSKEAQIEFNFTSQAEAEKKLRHVEHAADATNTQAALRKCREELIFNEKAGARPESYKSVLIVTDGQSNVEQEKTLFEAFRLKNAGVQVFVIAVGKYIEGIVEVVSLASSTDAHLFRVVDMGSFVNIVKLIPPWHAMAGGSRGTWLEGMRRQSHYWYKS